jgi:hypothetical protein
MSANIQFAAILTGYSLLCSLMVVAVCSMW